MPTVLSAVQTQEFSVVSFFSGCGGLDLGFLGGFSTMGETLPRLPFRIIRAYDFSSRAVDTYRLNIGPEAEVGDLKKLSVQKMPASDVLIGGFPCQEFSRCGPRKGLESDRGKLYRAMVRYAKCHRPKLVVGENVADLLFINDGWDFRVIQADFRRAGYRCVYWKVNASDYGVPQHRRRVFVVFIRNDIKAEPIPPKAEFKGRFRTASFAIGDLVGIRSDSVANQDQYFKAALAGRGHGQGDEITAADEPAYAVRANAKSRIQFHYKLPRRLTVRECARLQTFPDSFRFPFAATENMRQIGNAVPPLLAHRVASTLADFLMAEG